MKYNYYKLIPISVFLLFEPTLLMLFKEIVFYDFCLSTKISLSISLLGLSGFLVFACVQIYDDIK